MTYALVVGESLVDVVHDALPGGTPAEYAGGSAANVAVALARLGRDVAFATAYADDARGRLIDQRLSHAGVALAGDPHVIERTSSATATIGADGSATYEFDLDWRLGPLAPAPAPVALHVCSFAVVLEPGAAAVHKLLATAAAGTWVSYDVNVRAAVTGTGPAVVAAVERVAARADLVKASDEDLAALYPGLTLEEAAGRLRSLGPAAVVVTRGADGATWFGDDTVSVPGVATTVVDTIGAGDTFSAALLDALWETGPRGADPAAALTHAARAAAVTVGRPGADPPYRDELGEAGAG